MAAGWLRHLAGDQVDVRSAGSEPAPEVDPVAVTAMQEAGIDISSGQPERWTYDGIRRADVVVTMGCGDECPVIPGRRYEDWPLRDPSGEPLDVVRAIRDDIEDRVRRLIDSLDI